MKAAVIDIGTNTFHLLIGERENSGDINFIYKKTIPVKLGEGGIAKGNLTEAAIQKGVTALKDFGDIISEYKIKTVRAVATAAVRTASNGEDFIRRGKNETGLNIEVVDGDTEAELIFTGVSKGVEIGSETSIIMDIGGGSVEFILCNFSGIIWKKSYPIGVAKMMALFHHSDPINVLEIKNIEKYLKEVLHDLKKICAKEKPEILIGSSGAFETFAELVHKKFNLQGDLNATEYAINPVYFREIAKELLQSTHEERALNKGIIPIRVDMIVVSTVLTLYILNQLKIKKITLSYYALKEGALFQLLK